MQLVNEQNDPPLGLLDLLQDGLQALLELAAVLRPGHHRPQVQCDDLAVLQTLRDVAADDPLRQPLDDGGLAYARLADQDRVILGAAAEHLDHPADLLVAADDRVELAPPRQGGQVPAVLLQRLIRCFRVLAGDPLPATHLLQGVEHLVLGRAVAPQDLPGWALGLLVRQRQQEVLGGQEVVLQPLHLGVRLLEDTAELGRERRLGGAVQARHPGQLGLDLLAECGRVDLAPGRAGSILNLAQGAGDDALGVGQQPVEQVLGLKLRVLPLLGRLLGGEDGGLGSFGKLVQVDCHAKCLQQGMVGLAAQPLELSAELLVLLFQLPNTFGEVHDDLDTGEVDP